MSSQQNIWNNENLVNILKGGGIVVMPTDTIYGIVGKAQDKNIVERIYKIRKRDPEKPCIILIGDMNEFQKFDIVLTPEQKREIENHKEPTSFILDCIDEKFTYLHRGTNFLAFRLPTQTSLQKLLTQTGPLIAPSANIEGLPPAKNITEAKKYFGNAVDPVRSRSPQGDRSTPVFGRAASNGVDLYVDGGTIEGKASKVVRLYKDGSVDILRY